MKDKIEKAVKEHGPAFAVGFIAVGFIIGASVRPVEALVGGVLAGIIAVVLWKAKKG